MDKKIIALIKKKSAKIGVIGMGYVGLPLVKIFLGKGFHVFGFDIDNEKVVRLKKGYSYIKHVDFKYLSRQSRNGKFTPTTDFSKLRYADAIIICVPTPLKHNKKPDLSYVHKTVKCIAGTLRRGQLIVLESTTYPGTTREEVLPVLEKTGLRCERDFYLAYSPEREDPGNKRFHTRNIPKVVGGIGKHSMDAAYHLYNTVVNEVVKVSSCEIAESTKMLENIFRAINIALVNELKIFFYKMGVDIWEVIKASSTKPFGFMPFYPGPGWGGHCIPIDPFYLTWKAEQYGFRTRFIELAGEINTLMPLYIIEKVIEGLKKNKRNIKGAKVLIIGVSYKKDIDDIRESPAIRLIECLEKRGARVCYHDPYIREIPSMRQHHIKKKSVALNRNLLRDMDCVVIVTNHSIIDYGMISKEAKVIVDTRNVIHPAGKDLADKLIKA